MRKVLRILGFVLVGLLGLIVVAMIYVYAASSYRLNKKYATNVTPIAVRNDSATIGRGRHLTTAIAKCAECHGQNMGGSVFLDVPPMRVIASNLTTGKGGVGGQLKDEDWVRAVRQGVGPDSRALKIMPSEDFATMSDVDLAAIVAYIKSLPPVDNQLPTTIIRPLGRMLLSTGQLPILAAERIPRNLQPPAAPQPAVTVEYGRYLANIGGCTGCHGPGLSGGLIPGTGPGTPPAANITPDGNIGKWSEADFFRALREGKRPDGSTINPFMPYRATKLMTDDEIKAVLIYLRTVPPKPYGNR